MPELEGLDAPLDEGGGVAVERGEDGVETDEMLEPRVLRRRIAVAADMRRPRADGERSDEPRMRWLYLTQRTDDQYTLIWPGSQTPDDDRRCRLPVLRRKASPAWKVCPGDVRPRMALLLDRLEQPFVL